MPIKLRPHQEEGVAKLHNGCILYGDVGVGKTITSLAYYFTRVCGGELNKWGSMTTPKDVYVITTAKVRDSMTFEVQAAAMHIHADPEVSTNGVKITVDSWNNLHKYVGVRDAFFIFDEQRVVGYGAWARAFIKVAKDNEWILLSATPGDTWLDYIPVFIANGWYRNKTHFTDEHVIWTPRVKYPKVLRYQNVGVLVRRRNQVLVHMPYERHTVRHAVDIWCDYNEDDFNKAVKKRWHVYEQRPLRDVAELFSVMRRVVNSDASRIQSIRGLLTTHPRLIVFYNFDYELEALRELGASMSSSSETSTSTKTLQQEDDWDWLLSAEGMAANCPGHWTVDRGDGEALVDCGGRVCRPSTLKSGGTTATSPKTASALSNTSPVEDTDATFAVAEYNGHKHEDVPTTERWLYLVQYRAGAEGWNCITTDAICFYSQTYSYRDWFQAHGRIDRLNTPYTNLWYYHLVSKSIIDKAIRAALRVKKSFNERDLDLGEFAA